MLLPSATWKFCLDLSRLGLLVRGCVDWLISSHYSAGQQEVFLVLLLALIIPGVFLVLHPGLCSAILFSQGSITSSNIAWTWLCIDVLGMRWLLCAGEDKSLLLTACCLLLATRSLLLAVAGAVLDMDTATPLQSERRIDK